ncbi:LOW QUALITY PROTEIN: extracellular protein [Bacillus sp. JCM 19046]|nr:LOW QUALITY PROTEIN: extracellular protein [Bacillus sp. JCM 19046]
MKRKLIHLLLVSSLLIGFLMPSVALADAVPGDVFITLGEDLTSEQKDELLNRMEVSSDVETLVVTNEEEHTYLGDYISARQIGNRALSSSKITIGESGTGIHVKSDRINWVTNEMYANALITAGVKDADVYVTAPFDVSGTAALTGLIKAYESAADIAIPEEQKEVANEEWVRTAELAETIGNKEANELIIRIKEEIATTSIETTEEMRTIIVQIAEELNITITDNQMNELTALFMKMKDLNIDWNVVSDQLDKARENLTDFMKSDEAKSFLDGIIDALKGFFNSIRNFFSS